MRKFGKRKQTNLAEDRELKELDEMFNNLPVYPIEEKEKTQGGYSPLSEYTGSENATVLEEFVDKRLQGLDKGINEGSISTLIEAAFCGPIYTMLGIFCLFTRGGKK